MADMLRDIDERRQAQGGRDAAGELEAEKKWWTNTINLMFDLEVGSRPSPKSKFSFPFGDIDKP